MKTLQELSVSELEEKIESLCHAIAHYKSTYLSTMDSGHDFINMAIMRLKQDIDRIQSELKNRNIPHYRPKPTYKF